MKEIIPFWPSGGWKISGGAERQEQDKKTQKRHVN
jgi:hypothetical protein